MEYTKTNSYSLYQTFSHNIPKKDLTLVQKKKLVKKLESLEDNEMQACLRLILEHARLNSDQKIVSELPYNGEESEDGFPIFDISELPQELRWVLHKFVNVCDKNSDS